MTHTYSKTFFHLIWSTKNRKPLIDPTVKPLLYSYINGIIEKKKCKLHLINGMPDHVHLLVSLPLTMTVPELVQQTKVSSTRWLRGQFNQTKEFSWQEGLGAFTVGYSNFNDVKKYIENQEHHHRTMTFEEEYLSFLNKLNIPYDKRFVLG